MSWTAAVSALAAGLQSSMSECTALPPESRRRSSVRRRFSPPPPGQSPARNMAAAARIRGPVYCWRNSSSASGLTCRIRSPISATSHPAASDSEAQSAPAPGGSCSKREKMSRKSILMPSSDQSRMTRSQSSTQWRRTWG
jgi:hypothetical protein